MMTFSISEALGAGFKLIRYRPLTVLAWGAVLVLPIAVVFVAMFGLLGHVMAASAATAAGEEPSAQMMAAMVQFQAAALGVNVLQMLGYAMLTAAICRAVFYPERRPRWFDLRIGMDELRVIVTVLVVGVGVYAGMIVVVLLAAAIGAAFWLVSQATAVIVGLVAFICGILGVLVLAVHASLIAPVSVATGEFAFERGWRLAKGQLGRLVLMALAIVAIIILIEVLVVAVAGVVMLMLGLTFRSQLEAWSMMMSEGGGGWALPGGLIVGFVLLFLPLVAAIYGALTTLYVAPFASAARQLLSGARDERPGSALS